jgi:hypothetical protein
VIVAGIVIETMPGAAPHAAARLLRREGLELQGGDGHRRLAAVWTAKDGATLEAFAKQLLAEEAEIVGIFPTFVGDDEDPPR